MTEVRFIDTTIRDGQASLWAMNMRTAHMMPVMPHLDDAGFDRMEFLAGSRFKKFIRDLKENPWHWIYEGKRLAQKTELQIPHLGEMSGYVPPSLQHLFTEMMVDLGFRVTRQGNNWNNYEVVKKRKAYLESMGVTPVINVMYSVSPKHTDDYFIRKATEAAALNPHRLVLKDVAGLLTPERTRTLMTKMREKTGEIPWEFHGHCNNGLGPLNALEAVKAGARYVHVAVPPLANGSSQPSVFNVVRNLRALGYEPVINDEVLKPVQEHLTYIAQRENLPIGVPREYEHSVYGHQIPGGMISNLRYQLQKVGMEDRFEETLEETGRVRADFGYPIMVTPLSQFVGSQAAINVIVGERYKQVTDEVIHWALGRYGGDEAIESMDPEVRAKILDRGRARELERWDRPDPSLKELRQRYGETISDQDLILRAVLGEDAVEIARNAGVPRPHITSGQPLVQLVQQIAANRKYTFVSIRKGDLGLTVGSTSVSRSPEVP